MSIIRDSNISLKNLAIIPFTTIGFPPVNIYKITATVDAQLFRIKEIAEDLTKLPEIFDVLYWLEDIPVKKEWTVADAMSKSVIPIFIKSDHIPPLLRSRLGFEFDTFDFDKNIKKLNELILKKSQV